jgi:hypothetical protein
MGNLLYIDGDLDSSIEYSGTIQVKHEAIGISKFPFANNPWVVVFRPTMYSSPLLQWVKRAIRLLCVPLVQKIVASLPRILLLFVPVC